MAVCNAFFCNMLQWLWLYKIELIDCIVLISVSICLYVDGTKNKFIGNKQFGRFLVLVVSLLLSVIYIVRNNSVCLSCLLLYFCACFIYYYSCRNSHAHKVLLNKQVDLLYRSRLFNRTPLQIRKLSASSKQGVTIGICGQWGSGKTFFLNDILRSLSHDVSQEVAKEEIWSGKYTICDKVELWEATSPEDVWKRVEHSLYMGIYGRPRIDFFCLSNIAISILSMFCSQAKVLKDIVKVVQPDYKYRKIDFLNKELSNKKVILVFDDFERADFKVIQAILPLFDRLKQIPNLVVICAVAEKELTQVFSSNGQNPEAAMGYLTKLFDLKIELPAITYSAVRNYLESLFANKYRDCIVLKSFMETYPLNFDNARQMIRVIDKLANLERQYFNGCPYLFSKNYQDEKCLDVLHRIKYIFLVESLRVDNVKILNMLVSQMELCDFMLDIPVPIIRTNLNGLFFDNDTSCYDFEIKISYEQKKRAKWITENEDLYRELLKKGNVWSVFSVIRSDIGGSCNRDLASKIERDLHSAYNLSYTRCVMLEEWEKIEISHSIEYEELSYSDKVKKYCGSRNEHLEYFRVKDVAFSLFEFELLYKIGQSHGDSLRKSLDAEYRNRDCEHTLCGNERFMGGYFMAFVKRWSVNDKNQINYQKSKESLFLSFYKIMPLKGQANVLSHFFSHSKDNFSAESAPTIEESTNVLYQSADFAKLVESLCFEYGLNWVNCISSFIRHGKELLTSEFRAYQYTEDSRYLTQIKRGLKQGIKDCPDIETFVLGWFNLMSENYRGPFITDDVVSLFVTNEVCCMMEVVWSMVHERLNEIEITRQGKNSIMTACGDTIKLLHDDIEQWEKCNRDDKEKYCTGTKSLVELLEKVKTDISARERLPA